MIRALLKAALALALVGGLAAIYRSDWLVFEVPDARMAGVLPAIREQLTREHGVVMLLTFDEPSPIEWASGAHLTQSGVEVAPGHHGKARRFNGDRRTFIETSVDWRSAGDRFTLSTWIQLDAASRNQDIVFSRGGLTQVGLALDDGKMAFYVPTPGATQAVAYPFDRYGEFTHVVAVVDAERGVASLYENGELKATSPIAPVRPAEQFVEFGKRRWFAVRRPLRGVLDETVLWRRVLTSEEIAEVYRSRASLIQVLSPKRHARWTAGQRERRAIRSALKAVDYVDPGHHGGRASTANLPAVDLYLSKSDRRHINAAHRESRASGRRTRRAADRRTVQCAIEGRACVAELHLDGTNTFYSEAERPSFVVELASRDDMLQVRRLRLSPPENDHPLYPLLETELARRARLPFLRNGFCRLSINGMFAGIYYYEDYETMGVLPGQGGRLLHGPRRARHQRSLFRQARPSDSFRRTPFREILPYTAEELLAAYKELEATHRAALTSDIHSEASSREIGYRLRWDRRRLLDRFRPMASPDARLAVAASHLTEFVVVGGNPSPSYIVTHLDLDVLALPGVTIAWKSSAPDIVSESGRVTRPNGDHPVAVELTAHFGDGRISLVKKLAFRVMPWTVKVPALMVHTGELVRKCRRVDAVIHYFDGRPDRPPKILNASQDTGGGISHRGATGYWKSRKSISIRTDRPHGLLDRPRAVHLLLGNAYFDPTMMRNRLSYDLFRSFSSPDSPRHAVAAGWAEVFVNGQYHSLQELTGRVDADLLGFDPEDASGEAPPFILSHENVQAATVGRPSDMRVDYPWPLDDRALDRYGELLDFLSSSSSEEFQKGIERRVDLDNAIDFQILLNVTGNDNGWPFEYAAHDVLAHPGGAAGRFFFVPWDFDNTFGSRLGYWYDNGMIRRLQAEHPAYRQRAWRRWRELRAGPLRADVLSDRVDEMTRRLSGHWEWNQRVWSRSTQTLEEAAAEIKAYVAVRLDRLDREYQGRFAGPVP